MGWRPSISSLCGVLHDRVVLTPQLEGDQLGSHEQEPLALVRWREDWFFALRFHLVLLTSFPSCFDNDTKKQSCQDKGRERLPLFTRFPTNGLLGNPACTRPHTYALPRLCGQRV